MNNKKRNHEGSIATWGELRALMRKWFISSHYHRDFYLKLQSLTLGLKSRGVP